MKPFRVFVESIADHVFYHGTTSAVVDSILNKGLIPHATPRKSDVVVNRATGDRLNSVYLTKHYRTARDYADVSAHAHTGHPVVLQVNVPFESVPNVVRDEDEQDGWRFRGAIPASWVAVHSAP
jgi:RNA:NAD 2'-phosphotransferase (TPT1/KptA family)